MKNKIWQDWQTWSRGVTNRRVIFDRW